MKFFFVNTYNIAKYTGNFPVITTILRQSNRIKINVRKNKKRNCNKAQRHQRKNAYNMHDFVMKTYRHPLEHVKSITYLKTFF